MKKPKAAPAKKAAAQKSEYVMVTFGRGCADLKRNFDRLAEAGGYTRAGFALALIREGVEKRIGQP